MIHIEYKLDKSAHHGVGLFTSQDIDAGEVVYTANPLLDVNITIGEFEDLEKSEQDEIRWWGFFDQPSQRWHVDFDVSKFINHSFEGNITQSSDHDEAYLIASKDIKAGEELVQNYLEFETEEDLINRGINLK